MLSPSNGSTLETSVGTETLHDFWTSNFELYQGSSHTTTNSKIARNTPRQNLARFSTFGCCSCGYCSSNLLAKLLHFLKHLVFLPTHLRKFIGYQELNVRLARASFVMFTLGIMAVDASKRRSCWCLEES